MKGRLTSGRLKNVVMAAIIFFAAVFMISLLFRPYPGSFMVKALPALICALAAVLILPKPWAFLAALGFFLCALGDMVVEIDMETYLNAALALFGVAYFLIALVLVCLPRPVQHRSLKVFVIYGAVFVLLVWLYLPLIAARVRELGSDPLYLVLYSLTVCTLAAVCARSGSASLLGGGLLLLGSDLCLALIFLFSDRLLIGLVALTALVLYYAGLFALIFGLFAWGRTEEIREYGRV